MRILMRFTQNSSSARNVVRAYGAGEIRINDSVFRDPLIVDSAEIRPGPAIGGPHELTAAHAAELLTLEPELVVVGTGVRQVFPATEFSAPLLAAGVGVEIMDTGAACRTFNVLVAEQRRVVALLLP
jgi:uncharacterized protein